MPIKKELIEKRTSLYGQIKKLADEFNTAGQKWKDGEQQKTWDTVNKDYDAVMADIDAAKKADEVADRMKLVEAHSAPLNPGKIGLDDAGDGLVGGTPAPGTKTLKREQVQEARSLALAGWCRAQMGIAPTKQMRNAAKLVRFPMNSKALRFGLPSTRDVNRIRDAYLNTPVNKRTPSRFEYNAALSAITGTLGGDTVVPETLLTSLEVNMLAYGAVRQVADQIVTSTGEDLAWPTADDTSNEGRMLVENAASDDNAGTGTSGDGGPNPSFAKVIWGAYKFTSDAVLVPFELLQDSVFDLPGLIGAMLGERLGRITNRKYTTGSGAASPEGIVTGSSLGVTAAGAAAITADEIIDLEHSLDPAYRDGAAYMFRDTVLAYLRKLKDTTNRYLWQAEYNTGAPDTLNNRPYYINQHMDALATTNKTVIFGQFSRYKIRRVGEVRLYRLEERYRHKDQDGFVAFLREDGGTLNAGTAPVKHLKQA